MKKLILFSILPLFLFLNSCSEDCDCTDPADEEIFGLWERTVTDDEDQTFDVMILFEQNGDFSFLLAENAEGHNNSYAEFEIDQTQITITNDSDCGSDGIYSYDLSDDELILTAGSDECSQRKVMIEAEWERVE